MRISDWSSDVCSSDLIAIAASAAISPTLRLARALEREVAAIRSTHLRDGDGEEQYRQRAKHDAHRHGAAPLTLAVKREFLGRHDSSILSAINAPKRMNRSEEHTSELQSLMRISYAVFCLQKKK